MAAGFLLSRAAGMKNGGAFFRRNAGKLQFLERGCRHGGNLRPVFNHAWRQSARFADSPIGGVICELESEKLQCKGIKIPEGRVIRVPIPDFQVRASWNSTLRGDAPAQARGKA